MTTTNDLTYITRVQGHLVDRGDIDGFWLMHRLFMVALREFCAEFAHV